jgi:hypothetical protein
MGLLSHNPAFASARTVLQWMFCALAGERRHSDLLCLAPARRRHNAPTRTGALQRLARVASDGDGDGAVVRMLAQPTRGRLQMSTWGEVGRLHGHIKGMCQYGDGVVIATERRLFLLKDGKLSKLTFELTFDMAKESADWSENA